jgi:hypothetical protein
LSPETHTEPEEIVSDHFDVATDALTDAIAAVVPGVSSSPEPSADDVTRETDEKGKN